MKRISLLCLLSIVFLISKAQIVSFNAAELGKLKELIRTDPEVQKQWKGLMETANTALNAVPNPADTILTEGLLVGDPRKTKTIETLNDMPKVYAFSYAYKITGEEKFLSKAVLFLSAWANKNKPQGNPINDTNLDQIIFAYDLLKEDLTPDANKAVRLWLKEVGDQEIKSYKKAAKGNGKTHFNNWNSHRIKTVAEVAWAINDKRLQDWALAAFKRQISQNLLPDGSSIDFHERDALHYHIYDVNPLLLAATIIARAGNFGENPYLYRSKEGSSLKKSIDWLIPFFTGEKTHAEWVNSTSAFDKKRAANGEKGYIAGTLFKPLEARSSIALASYFEPQLLTVFQAEGQTKENYPTWQFVLNEVKR
jgi:hypothetical protein